MVAWRSSRDVVGAACTLMVATAVRRATMLVSCMVTVVGAMKTRSWLFEWSECWQVGSWMMR